MQYTSRPESTYQNWDNSKIKVETTKKLITRQIFRISIENFRSVISNHISTYLPSFVRFGDEKFLWWKFWQGVNLDFFQAISLTSFEFRKNLSEYSPYIKIIRFGKNNSKLSFVLKCCNFNYEMFISISISFDLNFTPFSIEISIEIRPTINNPLALGLVTIVSSEVLPFSPTRERWM